MNFNKPPLILSEQVSLLESRGMIIDRSDADKILGLISYYRFCGYGLHFEIFKDNQRTDRFKEGTKFSDVLLIYNFDNDLRNLLQKYLTLIEISMRAAMCYELTNIYNDAHCYLNQEIYDNSAYYEQFIEKVESAFKRSKELFVKAYKNKYSNPPLPPFWMMIEIVSFGIVSKIFSNLKNREDKKNIAKRFKCSVKDMESWLYTLSVFRNHCAHHSRIWNRTFSTLPRKPKIFKSIKINNCKLVNYCFVISKFLKEMNLNKDFGNELAALFDKFSDIPKYKMGFNDDIVVPDIFLNM
jgi:abortive infection bacteriophage resistance protein